MFGLRNMKFWPTSFLNLEQERDEDGLNLEARSQFIYVRLATDAA